MIESISNLESIIRDLVNKPRKRSKLIQEQARWNKLCSSMDIIGDTELAINKYLEDIEKPASSGELYILIYGILQILFVQQDAAKNLAEALSIDYEPSSTLNVIRDLRNDSVGHPTKRGGGTGKSFNFITRISMTRRGFTLLTSYPESDTNFKRVDIVNLIEEQRKILADVLNNVIELLKREDMEHRDKFNDEKLQDIFPQTLHYFLEKIAEAIFYGGPPGFGPAMVEIVENVLREFEQLLEAREILSAYELEDDIEWARYPLREFKVYFENPNDTKLNEKDAYIFLSFVRKQKYSLREIAEEIDNDYQGS